MIGKVFDILEIFGFLREFWRIVRARLEYIYLFPKKKSALRGATELDTWYVKGILKTRVVWGWRNDVDGEHWRTSVCANKVGEQVWTLENKCVCK